MIEEGCDRVHGQLHYLVVRAGGKVGMASALHSAQSGVFAGEQPLLSQVDEVIRAGEG